MEKIKNFLANKAIGYYIVCGIAFLSLLVGIIFLASYNNPNLEAQMGNKAAGFVVETIGIFLLAAFAVEVVVLVIPQYRFIQLAAIAMIALAYYKDILVIPDFIVGKINNVEYNGGNFGLNMFFFISITLMFIASIVAPFVGFIKSEEDNKEEMKIQKGNSGKLIKISACALVVVAAVLASSLISSNLVLKKGSGNNKGSNSQTQQSISEPEPEPDPLLTDEIKAAAEAYVYDFDPSSVIMKEQAEYTDFSAASSVPTNANRADHNLVYYFEGAYSEGYQGDYSPTYAYLYLWDDGLFGGRAANTDIKGFWYNSSIAEGQDPETGADIRDCLRMVTNISHYESIIANPKSGFYQFEAYMYLRMTWGGDRSIIMNGYEYYPEVAMLIDPQGEVPEAEVGKEYDMSFWSPSRVLKNLSYSSVFIPTDVTWEATNGSIKISYVDNDKNRGIASIIATFTQSGEQTITAKWKDFSASITVTVR